MTVVMFLYFSMSKMYPQERDCKNSAGSLQKSAETKEQTLTTQCERITWIYHGEKGGWD